MAYAPPWMNLAYQLAQDPQSDEVRLAGQLPGLLSKGASVLELARRLGEPPQKVAPLLEKLAAASVVFKEGSGMSVPFCGASSTIAGQRVLNSSSI